MQKLSLSIFAFCILAFAISVSAQTAVSSGAYDSLLLAVDANGNLTGYFYETTGMDEKGRPRFTCAFLISGKQTDEGRFEIKTWHPIAPEEVIQGEIVALENDGERSVRLKLDSEHGGCWNVAPMLSQDEGVEYELSSPADWQAIRMAASAKVFFHKAADKKTRLKTYVVKGNVVRVHKVSGEWADAEYINESGKSVRGWLLLADMQSDRP
ncbi:MAG: hypothetical protein KF685_03495 [Acidobacteria bacterium]|nr:hypothetical protein [Acidobacteriota bacterium]